MKVLYLMDQMHTHGGGEKILSLKMNALVTNFNCEVHLYTTEHANKKAVYPISSKVKWFDLGINYNRSKSYFHPINGLKTIQHFFKLKQLLQKLKPDVIISVSQSPEQYFLPFIHKRIPKVKEFHSSGVNYSKPANVVQKLKEQLFLLYHNYDTLVVLNNDEKQYYPFKNVVVIPNFIQKQQLKSIGEVHRANVIIAAGRIAPVKQFDHLIKAWSFVATKFPSWEVHIYGDGDIELSKKLIELIQKLKVPNIYLKGATSSLTSKMKQASIYALTSATECFPMVLLESLACGLPILSYDCPHGPKNIITQGEDGILVEANNIKEFANKLTELIQNKDKCKQMRLNTFKKSVKFGENRVMQLWFNLFKEMVK